MRAFLLMLLTVALLPFAVLAQSADRPNTILVLDGSGSMWGQIDGVNKIVIAREVIADLLADMADDVSLGLTVYGHRERGSCTDIETIVEPAPFTQDRILDAVNAINPRGRTPMTDSVIAAAQALRHTEEAATVILVSDGIENCNPDPCAFAAELEAAGIAFTAHVIGFDVASEPEARAQMQCIADNTGGQFLTADNAAELSAALNQIVDVVMPVQTRIEAVVTPGMTPPTRPIIWTVLAGNGDVIAAGIPGPAILADLYPGDYVAEATRTEPGGNVTYQTAFSVLDTPTAPVQVPMPAIVETSPVTFSARVEPDMVPPISSLAWTLYDAAGTVVVGPVEAPGGTVALLPGDYRFEVERASTGTRHSASFTVEANTPQEVIIPLPALLVDITLVARIGDVGGLPVTDPVIWEVTPLDPAPQIATTNPAMQPLSRGAYRVTAYWTAQEIEAFTDFVVTDQAREIVVVFPEPLPTATLTAPATAPAAADIEVAWDGPGETGDMILIHHPDTDVLLNVARVDGNPVTLRLPAFPGRYDITYRQDNGNGPIIGSTAIDVTDVAATLTAPDSVQIGEEFQVAWDAPGYRQDRIALVAVGDTASRSSGGSVSSGNPLDFTAPSEPGQYELHYVLREAERVIGTRPIEVTAVQATLTAPSTAVAGSTIEVAWTGPDANNDYIGIGRPDRDGDPTWENYSRTRDGATLRLLVPPVPGDYLISYFLNQDRSVLASVPITVTPAEATLTLPETAVAGSTIEVAWTGPDYTNDFIGIGRPDRDGDPTWENYTRTRDGSPLRLLVPSAPGEYQVTYFMDQDRVALASVPLTVTDATATVTAPATAVAGSTIEVAWTGPDYVNDFIGIGRAGAEGGGQWQNYTRTRDGNPLRLVTPPEPGTYVIRYIVDQDRVTLAEAQITLTAPEASVTAPATAVAGSTIEVAWTGPDFQNDFIGIGRAGATGGGQWQNYTRTRDGNPLRLVTPPEPGTYVIRYIVDQDRVTLAEARITLTAPEASITAPATAVAGSTIEVAWMGPDFQNDFIGIGRAGAEGGGQWQNYTRTRDGNPLRLVTPPEPGTYVIRYIVDQDRVTLAEAQITLTAPEASITAPASAPVGSTIELAWSGPDYPRDFIGIGRAGATGGEQWQNYTRTQDGSPLRLVMPVQPGDYVIRYLIDQDRVTIAEVPITLTDVEATLTAPATAPAGGTIEVAWTGPDYPRDFIGLGRSGATGGDRWQSYSATSQGSPLTLNVPDEPGSYVLRYFIDQDRRAIGEVSITVQ